jgi:inositol-phosphate phosphatase / L-galactose 1-phosphate phosphatase / histidinol-phosphatase
LQLKNNEDFLTLAHQLADASGDIARRHFRGSLAVTLKSDASPVTQADREIEQILRERIITAYPGHGIIGEEFGNSGADSPYQWVIDPIDGTKSFIAGYPLFCTLIALLHNGVPVLGLIDQPILNERWAALADATPAEPYSAAATLTKASLATTSTGYFSAQQAQDFARLKAACASTTLGGDAYAYAMLAEGSLDVVVDGGMKPYDYLPLVCPLQAAGVTITDWQGAPLGLLSDGAVLAARTPALHAEALKILRER